MEKVRAMPARLYHRYRAFFDRLVPSLGMTWIFVLASQATGSFSTEWLWFIAGSILVAGVAAPLTGYILFVLALAYPLYSISIYVAALALAVLVGLAFFVTRHFAATIMFLVSPLVGVCGFAPVVPFLAGLWWAEWGGVLVGMGTAVWLKIFAGMCGVVPDLIQLSGQELVIQRLLDDFHAANSLQTLLRLVEPLTPDSQTLLLHILEILGWGLAGYLVGLVRRRIEGSSRPAIGLFASVSAGLLGLWFGSLVVPVVLGLRDASNLSISALLDFLVECILGGIVAVVLFGGARYLARPVVLQARSRSRPRSEPDRPSPSPEPIPRPWTRPQSRRDEDEPTDIIMIDLD